MADTINIKIETSSDLKAIDQLIQKMQKMRNELERVSKELRIGSEFAREINKAVAAANKLAAANKKMAQTAKQAAREQEKIAKFRMNVAAKSLDAEFKAQEAAENRRYRIIMNSIAQENKAREAAAREASRIAKQEETEANRTARAEQQRAQQEIRAQQLVEREAQRVARSEAQAAAQAARAQQQAFSQRMQAMTGFRNSLSSLSTAIGNIMGNINRFISAISGGFNRALSTASRAVGTLASSAGSSFARLRSYLDSTGKSFLNFGSIVGRSMNQGTNAMQKFYAAGFSLVASGAIMNRLGDRIFGTIGNMISGYTDYERNLNRLAISAAVPNAQVGAEVGAPVGTNPDILQQLVFGLQRGTYGQQSTFSAKDLAQALYYFTSAIGQPVGTKNMADIGAEVSKILTMAQVTQTDVQTATKGVLNIAMEFGFDPRKTATTSKDIQNIAAQLGYLANISSMEVPDIVETFKMLGPMAHILSDSKAPGAGLNETFALTFFASEMGLRGGNVGRGVNQLMTTLLDPTDKAIGVAAEAWGKDFGAATKENWQKFFFDSRGGLKGGLEELFQKIGKLPDDQAASILAALFTTNATRSAIAIRQAITQHGGIAKWMAESDIGGKTPMDWLTGAQDAYIHTLFGAIDNFKNAWFQVQTALVDGIKGPLISVLNLLADAFFKVADFLSSNPFIAQFIGAITVAAGAVATFVGGLLVTAGTLLLLARGFAMVGAAAHPFFILLTALPRLFMLLSPMIFLLAGAVVALYTAWTHNFMGMRDAIQGFIKSFDFDTMVVPKIMALMTWVVRFGKAFQQLIAGIFLGIGPTNNLGALLQSIFGPLVGTVLYSNLLKFGKSLDGVRKSFINFVSSLRGGALVFGNIARTLQGFIEQIFGFEAQQANRQAQDILGKALGINNLSGRLQTAATSVRSFVYTVIGYFTALKRAIFDARGLTDVLTMSGFAPDMTIAEKIRNNIRQIMAAFSGDEIRNLLKAFLTGFGQGLAGAIMTAARALEIFTRALAHAGTAGSWISDHTKKWFGFATTIEGVTKAIGVAIGAWLGTRLIAAITPGFVLILKLGTVLGQLGVGAAGLAIQFALFAAKVVVSTAAIAAEVAVTTILIGARTALLGIGLAYTAYQAYSIAQQAAKVGVTAAEAAANTALAGSFVAVLAAMGPVVIAMAALLGVSIAIIGIGAVLLGIFVSIAAIMVIHTAVTQGLGAAWQALTQIFDGFMSVMGPVFAIVAALGEAIGNLIAWVGNLLGVSDKFRAIGVAIGVALTIMITGVGLLVVALVGLVAALVGAVIVAFVSWVVALVAANLPIIILVGSIIFLMDKFGLLEPLLDSVGGWFDKLGSRILTIGGIAVDVAKAIVGAFTDSNSAISQQGQNSLAAQAAEMRAARDTYISSALDPTAQASTFTADRKIFDRGPTAEAFQSLYGRGPSSEQELTDFLNSERGKNVVRQSAFAQWNREHANIPGNYPTDALSQAALIGSGGGDPVAQLEAQARQQGAAAGKAAATGTAEGAEDGWQGAIKKAAHAAGLDKIYAQLAGPDGILNFDEIKKAISPEGLKDLMGQGYDQFDINTLFPWMKQYQKDVDAYQAWQDEVAKRGLLGATTWYKIWGKPIPTKAPDIADYINSFLEQTNTLNEEEQKALEDQKKFNDEYAAALQGMDLATLLNTAYAKTPRDVGKMNVAGFLAQNAEKIVGNIGDAAPWVNQVELMMDAAISGGLSKGVLGVNVHKVLEGPLSHISEQTGVSVNDMLKDIPKFVFDEGMVPFVVDGMMKNIGKLPSEVRKALDVAGADIGQGIAGAGLDWQEVAQYAVSKTMAGQRFTMVDYLMDAWDMTRTQAADYIQSHGLDPNIISDALIPDDVKKYIEEGAGQYSVLTRDAYQFLQDHIVDESNKVAEVTQKEWDRMSDIQKAAFTKMGYTFVITGDDVAADLHEGYGKVIEQLRKEFAEFDETGTIDPEHARFKELKDLGDGWVEIQDLFSKKTIKVPKLDWEEYKKSVDGFKDTTDHLKEIYDTYLEMWNKSKNIGDSTGAVGKPMSYDEYKKIMDTAPWQPGMDPSMYGMPADSKTASGQDTGSAGLPSPGINKDSWEASGRTGSEAADKAAADNTSKDTVYKAAVKEKVQAAWTEAGTTVDLSAFATGIASKLQTTLTPALAQALQTALNSAIVQMGAGRMNGSQDPAAPAAAPSGGPFDSIFQGYATSAATAFQNELNAKMPGTVSAALLYGAGGSEGGQGAAVVGAGPFDSIFQGYGTSAAEAFKNALNTSLAGFTPQLPALGQPTYGANGSQDPAQGYAPPQAGSQTITIDVVVNNAAQAQTEIQTLLDTATKFAVPWNSTIGNNNINPAQTELDNLVSRAGEFATDWNSAVYNDNHDVALSELQNLVNKGTEFAVDWVAWVGVNNYDPALSQLQSLIDKANEFDDMSATATVSLNDYANGPLQSVIDKLNAIDNRTVTSTVNNTTNNTTNNVTNNSINNADPAHLAKGGLVDTLYQIVGEKGQELAQLPIGTRVFTAQDTRKMFQKVADAVEYMSGPANVMYVSATSAKRSRPVTPVTATPEYMSARQMEVRPTGSGQGDVHIDINQLYISKEVDVDKAFERVDRLIGRKMELARRGMIPFEEARTM